MNPPPVALRVRSLTKTFGDVTAVDRLSLDVCRGEIFGFLGPNGAGKTTTIKMMCGLLRPDAGEVEVREGRRIGLSPQSIVLWETLTCLEQLEFMGRMYDLDRTTARRRALELLDAFGLSEKRTKLGRTLSGGMQRRLNIALALVHAPEILFLDEPQAGLDPQSRVLVREYIRGLSGRTTVILTTHDMEEAEKLSDRVCIIDHGRLLALDTVDGIKSRLGQGDLVEVEVDADVRTALLPHLAMLRLEDRNVTVKGRTLSLVTGEAAAVLPGLLQVVKERGLRLEHLRVRPKTLEDVFIHLTGRGLRE
ncbi:MAG: ABC transporter ATP-binding protein [Candidatus Aminicenantes bacterium]|nr:ABC transporter ATP-binding protein [Candidatus Aminicenantes bacterium]